MTATVSPVKTKEASSSSAGWRRALLLGCTHSPFALTYGQGGKTGTKAISLVERGNRYDKGAAFASGKNLPSGWKRQP